jgi:hypothetical protein
MHLSSTTCLRTLCEKDVNMVTLLTHRRFHSLLCICSKPEHKHTNYNNITVIADRQTHQTQTTTKVNIRIKNN